MLRRTWTRSFQTIREIAQNQGLEKAFEHLQRSPANNKSNFQFFARACKERSGQVGKPFLDRLIRYYHESYDTAHDVPTEAALTSWINLLLAKNRTDMAFTLLQDIAASHPSYPFRLRTVKKAFDLACEFKQFEKACILWDLMHQANVACTESEYSTFLCLLLAVGEQTPRLTQTIEQMKSHVSYLSLPEAQRLADAFKTAGWAVSPLTSSVLDASGHCSHCLQQQKRTVPAPESRQAIMNLLERELSDVKPALNAFKTWINRYGAVPESKYHVFLDGPNIAYRGLNGVLGYFRYDIVDGVARELQAQGHDVSIIMPGYYQTPHIGLTLTKTPVSEFHQRFHRLLKKEIPQHQMIVDSWKEQNLLFIAPKRDDLFWLYGSLAIGSQARVVTHDQIRDHVTLSERHGLPRSLMMDWKIQTQVQFEATEVCRKIDSIVFDSPFNYTRSIQQHGTSAIHFPIEQNAWLCVFN